MPFQQCAVWAFIITCCAIEFSMFVYACCVSWKRPRRCSLEITLVTIKCETFVSVLYVMLKPGFIRGSVVALVALVNLALMNTFSVFPYFDFVCSFKVTLITIYQIPSCTDCLCFLRFCGDEKERSHWLQVSFTCSCLLLMCCCRFPLSVATCGQNSHLKAGTRPLCFTLSCFLKPVLFGDWVNFY